MIFKTFKALRYALKPKSSLGTGTTAAGSITQNSPASALMARVAVPDWQHVLTESLKRNCVAPDDEIVTQAYDLWCDRLYGPLCAREHRLADVHADIMQSIAALQAYAPRLIERAMSRHPYQFADILTQKEIL